MVLQQFKVIFFMFNFQLKVLSSLHDEVKEHLYEQGLGNRNFYL